MTFAPAGTTLIERLGTGSVFEVGLVRDSHDRLLIVKRVTPRAWGADAENALARERDVLRVAHGAPLPELFSAGSDERGSYLLETRALGRPARHWLEQKEGPPDGVFWLALARAATRALARLHAWEDAAGPLGIAHGDISPDNLFFTRGGRVTLIDLSSATWRAAPVPAFAGDRGTLPYAAPEILRGESRSSQQTDVYALAATLLALAVGAITHADNEAGRLLEVGTMGLRSERIEERADLPAGARAALADALRFDAKERLCSAKELADRLAVL